MIEIKLKDKHYLASAQLYIDNKLIRVKRLWGESLRNTNTDEFDVFYSIEIPKRLRNSIGKYSIIELPNIKTFNFGYMFEIETFQIGAILNRRNNAYPGRLIDSETFKGFNITNDHEIQFIFECDLRNWNKVYNYENFWKTFRQVCKKEKYNYQVRTSKNRLGIAFVIIESNNLTTPVIKEIEKQFAIVHNLHEKTIKKLESQNDKFLLGAFNFPEELKIPCEQYLQYFARFLQDLGINVTSSLKEEAGKVLFSVTPIDDIEALDKIREALAVYLNLPSSPIVYDESFAAMRLKQQVDNLQHAQRMSEMEVRSAQYALRLADQTIENQDKIIQQKDSIIEQQNRVIEKITDKAVMINSAENKEELEEVFEGVKVGKSKFLAEQFGIHLNPATAVKSVGKKLLGKDEIIELGLDKKD